MHKIWTEMKSRCDDTSNPLYDKYGDLGIGYEPSWEDFEVFYREMKVNYSNSVVLSRYDSSKNFSYDNCYWMDVLNPEIDVRNYRKRERAPKEKKKLDKFFFYKGVINDLGGFSIQYNINYMTLKQRLLRGWSIERALTEPVREIKVLKEKNGLDDT